MSYTLRTKLAENITLGEMCRSQTATRYRIKNFPNQEEFDCLVNLSQAISQPIRDFYYNKNRWYLYPSSGFRCKKLNKRVGGSKYSSHMEGQAMDFDYERYGYRVKTLFTDILDMNLPFDQIIYEFGDWVHISHNEKYNRGEIIELYWYTNSLGYKKVGKRYLSYSDAILHFNESYDFTSFRGKQEFLHTIGCYTGLVDGIWGPKSQKSLRGFNKWQKIKPTNYWGEVTTQKAKEILGI